ncbi:MAG: ATP-binding protein [Muribaculaceae bacterium]|nr:ATP-binding protein [Muribaculaceae bacterium]
MKRKIYNKLKKWKEEWNGKTALLIDGARRVGKSWIAEEFGRNEYKSYIVIDFNNTTEDIKDLFDRYLSDLDTFFMYLSIFTKTEFHHRDTLIIFDEVQMFPKARAAIKYLVTDGRYDFIETGSLVSINHNVKDIVIPSEEVRVDMFPMDLEEFCWATGNKSLYDLVKKFYAEQKPLGNGLHRQMMTVLRTYIIVGGMPQAVESFVNEKDLTKVDAIKRNILALYRNDISKYAGKAAPKITRIFDNIPGALQKHEKRFRPSDIKKNGRMKDMEAALFWLEESRVANFCYRTTEPAVGLFLNKDDSKLKLYLLDTGLLLSMVFGADDNIEDIYSKIIRDKLEFNKGMIAENLVAQSLRSAGNPLFYFSEKSRTDAAGRMEIDFLIRKDRVTSKHNIIPIEVKSTSRYTISSLEKFSKKYLNFLSECIVLHTGDLTIKDGIKYLPFYMAGML